jgi:hypothetical protein
MATIRRQSVPRNAGSPPPRSFDKGQFVQWFRSLSTDEQGQFKTGLDREELDRWKTSGESLFASGDPSDKVGSIAADVLQRASRRRALGVPDYIAISDLKEEGARENAESKFRTRLREALKQTAKAARRLKGKLSMLRDLEKGRPSNQPRTIVRLIATANSQPPPSPTVSALARTIQLAESMNDLSLTRLEAWHVATKSRRGPRRDATVSLVQGALTKAGLSETNVGLALQSECVEGAGNARDRVRGRRRRGGPELRRK